MVVDEFLFKLGVVADLKQAKQFRQTLSDVARTASIAVTAVGALTGGITVFFAKALNGLDTLNQAARATGASAEYLQQLGFAAAQNGASMESALSSMRGLSKVIGEAADGMGRGARAFEHYGLSAKNADGSIKSVTHMIGELQNKMQRLSDPQRSAFLQKMGIDAAMLQTLRLSKAELHDLMQEAQELAQFQKITRQLAANIKALLHLLFAQLGNFASKAWENILKSALNQMADFIAGCFETAFNRVFHAWDKLTGWLTRGWAKLQSGFGLVGEKLNLTQAGGISQAVNVALAYAHPAASQMIQHHSNQSNRTHQQTVNQDIKISIAASDPIAAGRATADALRQQRIAAHNSQSAAKL
ncbi:hypothetical protein BGZ96_000971 [Linnemannia gamsii]|uniref:Phage tail tape measure protein n=1 Tax=Linnemannia gamsii TaxID=64522 RepID=A0ABQ7JN46_9FUNG|nr:hypothetical protein BGZ96_000971 [Linnemannia gamsii]